MTLSFRKHSLGVHTARRIKGIARYIALITLSALWLVPIIFVILTSFKSASELSLRQFAWLPSKWSFDNYIKAFSYPGYDWPLYFRNSIFVTVVTVIGSLFLNSLAGFAFARLNFRGRDILFMIFLAGMMVPPQSIIIPQYLVLKGIPFVGGNNWLGQGGKGLLDSLWGLIIPQLCGSFGVFLCKQFYLGFPKSLDDAARIDGCREFQIYWKIYLPQSTTILATLTILKSLAVWSDFFFPMIMTHSNSTRTVQLALQLFKSSSTKWNEVMAVVLVTILPLVIIFLCAQKYFIQSVVSSGMKN
ncbi:MAG: carbohydrate ABC transporter permease [Clostridia bacterium]|nr:carbohydrate ABC transporter permease [Clostridia bacterium]